MITLYAFGPNFGLPDSSPFVTKSEVLLATSGLPFKIDTSGFRKAPKGKLPYMNDGDKIVADSTFIRDHLQSVHGIDFDKGLTPEQRAIGWAFEKMCEDHLYWAIVDARWMVDANFDKGPRRFFDAVPAPIRPLDYWQVRRSVKRRSTARLWRHTRREVETLAARDLDAISAFRGRQAVPVW